MGILEALGVQLALHVPGYAPAVAGTAARPVRARISRPGLDDEVVVFETVHPDVALPFARALEAAHALEANRPSLDDMTINESARRSAGKLIAAPQNRRGRTVELAHRPPSSRLTHLGRRWFRPAFRPGAASVAERPSRSEEHTSELQSLMRISYAVFCLKKKKTYAIT